MPKPHSIANMHDSNHDHARPLASLMMLLLLLISSTIATTTSGTFEVDVLFPRNDTYAPQALMPFVFALQKPALSIGLAASISWGFWLGGNSTDPTFIYNGIFQPDSPFFTPNLSSVVEPFYLTDAVNTLAYPDGPWTFQWSVRVNNCSMQSAAVMYDGAVTFTTRKNATAPDLVAATSPGTCRNATGYAFDVMSVNERSCGVLGPYVASAANPCALSINKAAASSILASATANACEQEPAPEYSSAVCPKPKGEGIDAESGSTATASGLYMALVVAAAAVLVSSS